MLFLDFVNHILEHGTSLLIVLEHAPACAGRGEKNAVSAFGVFKGNINRFFHGFDKPIVFEAGFVAGGGDFLPCLTHEQKKLAFSDKVRYPVAVVGVLVIAAGNQYGA